MSATENTAKRDDIMRKVTALLAKAESTTFDAERDALLAKADSLMAAYAIEQFELNMARPASERETPEVRVVEHPYIDNFDVRNQLHNLWYSLASHCGVLIGQYRYMGGNDTYKVVGYRSDIDWLNLLFMNIQLHFLSRMEPKPDSRLSDVENFCMLREAGLDYHRIFELMGWAWEGEETFNAKTGRMEVGHGSLKGESNSRLRKMRKAYHDMCKAEGRQPVKGLKAETYRASFIRGYVSRIDARLYEMKAARAEAAEGKGLVLASRDNDLKESFWNEFPDRRPHPSDCECDTCHYIKCRDKACTRPRCVEGRKPMKYRAPKKAKEDIAAYALGQRVANDADLTGRDGRVAGGTKEELA